MLNVMLVNNTSGNYTGFETYEKAFGYNNAGDLFITNAWV
jgi:hypothetical protein